MEDADAALTVIISSPVAAALNDGISRVNVLSSIRVILVGVAVGDPDEPSENLAVPPVIVNEKSLTSKLPVPLAVLYTASSNVTVNVVLLAEISTEKIYGGDRV